jgi:4-amino-4-deoxy-L-arabinose transferase-like glycosyltransferase
MSVRWLSATLVADNADKMNLSRTVLLITAAAVAVLSAVLLVVSWNNANKIATGVSAVAAVAGVGVAVWAALSAPTRPGKVRVSNTGKATAKGGTAVSGFSAPAGTATGDVSVKQTGDAEASGGGDATSGTKWT